MFDLVACLRYRTKVHATKPSVFNDRVVPNPPDSHCPSGLGRARPSGLGRADTIGRLLKDGRDGDAFPIPSAPLCFDPCRGRGAGVPGGAGGWVGPSATGVGGRGAMPLTTRPIFINTVQIHSKNFSKKFQTLRVHIYPPGHKIGHMEVKDIRTVGERGLLLWRVTGDPLTYSAALELVRVETSDLSTTQATCLALIEKQLAAYSVLYTDPLY